MKKTFQELNGDCLQFVLSTVGVGMCMIVVGAAHVNAVAAGLGMIGMAALLYMLGFLVHMIPLTRREKQEAKRRVTRDYPES
jgi:hypothetical protein